MFRGARFRLAVVNGLALLTVLAILRVAGFLLLETRLNRDATDELRSVAALITLRIERDGFDTLSPALRAYRYPIRSAVFSEGGTLIAAEDQPPAWLRPAAGEVTDVAGDGGERTRIVTLPADAPDGRRASVVVARSVERVDAVLDEVRTVLQYASGLAIVLAALFGWWAAGRAVRPIMRSYEAQAAFAADASHELRTPLTFIRAGVEVLAEGRPDLGRQVLDEVDYMTALTNRLLLLARAERREVALDRRPFDIGEITRAAAVRSRAALGTEVTCEGPEIEALGDPVVTESILDVLFENVARHGKGRAVATWRVEDDRVVLRVVDRGEGVSSEDLERLFDRFFRIDPSRARESGGAGLGLPIARALAIAEGGTLRLEPTPGGGVTAVLDLPRP